MIPTSKRELGQYYTPLPLAKLMVELLGNIGGKSVLDPAVGSGNLIKYIHNSDITCYDIDKSQIDIINRDYSSVKAINEDFLESPIMYFDFAISNPPYIKYTNKWKNICDNIKTSLDIKFKGFTTVN